MNYALIVAAGKGLRMGNTDVPKQFLLVNGKPLLVYTIEAFEHSKEIDGIYVVTSKEYIEVIKDWCKSYKLKKIIKVIEGGDSRQESVYLGLKGMTIKEDDVVLIHDGARPLVTKDIIKNNIECCLKYDAADTVIRVSDTIINSKDGKTVNEIPSRDELYQSQTPQTFKYGLIIKAHEAASAGQIPNVTDDAKLVKALGKDVHLVEGNKQNFKITTPDDLSIFEVLIR